MAGKGEPGPRYTSREEGGPRSRSLENASLIRDPTRQNEDLENAEAGERVRAATQYRSQGQMGVRRYAK